MTKEEDVRRKVKSLKHFYLEGVNFSIVSVLLAIIWWTFDRSGSFWPKYIILGWGVWLIFQAYRKGILPLIFHRVSFFNEKWEEKKVNEVMRNQGIEKKVSPLPRGKKK